MDLEISVTADLCIKTQSWGSIKTVTANPQLHPGDLEGTAMMSDATNAVIKEVSR
jgi:hypothetical protein